MKSRLIATMAALALLAGSNAAPAGHEHRWGHGEQRWPAAPTSAWQPVRPGTMYERLHGEPRGGQRVQGHSRQYRDQYHRQHSQQYHNPRYRPHSQRLYHLAARARCQATHRFRPPNSNA